jgi:hypothetical protein
MKNVFVSVLSALLTGTLAWGQCTQNPADICTAWPLNISVVPEIPNGCTAGVCVTYWDNEMHTLNPPSQGACAGDSTHAYTVNIVCSSTCTTPVRVIVVCPLDQAVATVKISGSMSNSYLILEVHSSALLDGTFNACQLGQIVRDSGSSVHVVLQDCWTNEISTTSGVVGGGWEWDVGAIKSLHIRGQEDVINGGFSTANLYGDILVRPYGYTTASGWPKGIDSIVAEKNAAVAPSSGWLSAAKFGTTTLTSSNGNSEPPVNGEYVQLSDATGGGAVGYAPFKLHSDDCLPANTVTSPSYVRFDLSTAPDNTQLHRIFRSAWFAGHETIRVRFYGPLTVSDEVDPLKYYDGNICDPTYAAGGEGVTVEYNPYNVWAGWGEAYTVDVTDHFFIQRDPSDLNRDLILLPICGSDKYPSQGGYRIIRNDERESGWDMTGPFASRLRSAQVIGTPEVAPFAQYFGFKISGADMGVQGGTPGSDGLLDNNDYVVFYNWLSTHNPGADIGVQGGLPGTDGVWNNNDEVVFINWFFNPDGVDPDTGAQLPFATCDCGNRPAPYQGENSQLVSGGEPATQTPSVEEVQRQLEALWAIYNDTQDTRVLQRILDLGFTGTP